MNAPEMLSLTMQRHIRAPRDKVFDAFVNEALVRAWQCPRGMTVAATKIEARAGGDWRIEMKSREGASFTVVGSYKEFDRPKRLVYTWQWEGEHGPMPNVQTLIEITLDEKAGGTILTMVHSGFPAAAARAGHEQGWSSCFNRLNDLLDPEGSAGTITLLGDARSSYTRTVRMGLAEKGIAYTLQSAGPHTPELTAVHPFGKMPAMCDGEIKLWETSAILRYLDECFDSGNKLTPDTIIGRTRCEQWVSAINSYYYDTMIRRYVLQYIFPRGPEGQPDQKVIDAALAQMPTQLGELEKAYAEGDYLAGASLSFADLFLAPVLDYLRAFPEGKALLAGHPNISRAQALMRERASFVATLPVHQQQA